MSVREALIEINTALDEYLSQDEGELDADSRFALTFYESFGYKAAKFHKTPVRQAAQSKQTTLGQFFHLA
jgi:hypothetical protein